MGSRRAAASGNQGAGLLVSLLLRFPEIGTLHYDPRRGRLRFRFLITRPVGTEEFGRLRHRLEDALAVYHRITGSGAGVCRLSRHVYGDLTDLEVSRDLDSLSAEEVGLVIAVLQEACGEHLVSEGPGDGAEARAGQIGELLAGLRRSPATVPIVALREEGRVLVFHK